MLAIFFVNLSYFLFIFGTKLSQLILQTTQTLNIDLLVPSIILVPLQSSLLELSVLGRQILENFVLSISYSGYYHMGRNIGPLGISPSIIHTSTKHCRPQNTNNTPLSPKLKVYKVMFLGS